MIGKTINHYKILEKLGEGGMGVVYKAEDTKLKRLVALKFLPQSSSQNEEANQRFINEARAASALDHPNICTLYEIGDAKDGQTYMAMAYYAGQTLKDKIADGPLPVEEAVDVAIQTARGLARAHEEDITHRDIKPANIMVTERDEVKIVDFGLAKLAAVTKFTKSGMTLGTVSYMSPEQAQGIAVDHRTDIWSLGVVLYEMLTGKQPFTGDYDQAVVYSLINEKHEPLTQIVTDAPNELEAILEHALAKKPDDRYQTAEEMLTDLEVVSQNWEAVKSGHKPSRLKARRRSPFQTKPLAALVSGFLILAAGLWLFLGRGPASDERDTVSLAVLPLKGFGEEVSEDWFRDSMTDALITDLTKIGGLSVISQNSVMQYKNSSKPIPEIAKELQVEYVIDASLVKVGGQIRISAKLVDAPTNKNIWAENFQRSFSDVLRLQAELAQMIAKQVHVELTPGEQLLLASSPEVNPGAYEAYLRGRYLSENRLFESRDVSTPTNYYLDALAIDSTFALAHAGLAQLYLTASRGSLITPTEAHQKAWSAVSAALRWDPNLAEAYAASAQLKFERDWDWFGAGLDFDRALKLNPGNSVTLYYYIAYLHIVADFDRAIETAKIALKLDPLNSDMNLMLAFAFFIANRYDEAIEQLESMLALNQYPGLAHHELIWNYAMKEDYPRALATITVLKEEYPDSYREHHQGKLGFVYALAGEKEEAEKILETMEASVKQRYMDKTKLAIINAGLGDFDEAFRWLNQAVNDKSPNVVLPWPFLRVLYKDVRYKDFLKRLNFEEGDRRHKLANLNP